MDHSTPSSGALEPAGAATNPIEKSDDEILLEDLEEIAARSLRRLGPVEDRFEELYRVEPFHPFTAAPLTAPRPQVPTHLVAAAAALIFLAATASPLALAGFTKTAEQVTPTTPVVEEPYKPFPGLELDDVVEPAPAAPAEPVVEAPREVTLPPPAPAPRSRRARNAVTTREVPRTVEPEPAPAPAAAGEVGAVVDLALGLDEPLTPAPAAALPASPSRAEVLSALRGVSEPVARCGLLRGGRVTVDATVHGPTGRVTSVSVSGDDAGEVGACVERAVRGARFPRFADESFTIRGFPYTLDRGGGSPAAEDR
jgi:hypothetical protein